MSRPGWFVPNNLVFASTNRLKTSDIFTLDSKSHLKSVAWWIVYRKSQYYFKLLSVNFLWPLVPGKPAFVTAKLEVRVRENFRWGLKKTPPIWIGFSTFFFVFSNWWVVWWVPETISLASDSMTITQSERAYASLTTSCESVNSNSNRPCNKSPIYVNQG